MRRCDKIPVPCPSLMVGYALETGHRTNDREIVVRTKYRARDTEIIAKRKGKTSGKFHKSLR